MQLILMSGPFGSTRTFSIRRVHVVVFAGVSVLLALGLMSVGFVLALNYADSDFLSEEMAFVRKQFVSNDGGGDGSNPLDAMAIRLAEMRAQLARLDAISARLLKQNGMDARQVERGPLGQGGLQQDNEHSLSFRELKAAIKGLALQIERHADVLSVIDVDLSTARSKLQWGGAEYPLSDAVPVSNFGARIDPFTGKQAQHEGIDFIAPLGAPILAAAAGVVVNAAHHHGYGNMVEIKHDQKTVTRYAHASKLLVKPGDVVRLGQKIALVGSTGRSTGPHLHFEVRVDGQPKNPTLFLAKQDLPKRGLGTVSALNSIFSENIAKSLD